MYFVEQQRSEYPTMKLNSDAAFHAATSSLKI